MIHAETITVLSVGPSTSVETPGAVDATIAIDGKEHEVTLIPGHEGRLSSWGGALECWASPSLAIEVAADHLDRNQRELLIGRIEDAVRLVWRKVRDGEVSVDEDGNAWVDMAEPTALPTWVRVTERHAR